MHLCDMQHLLIKPSSPVHRHLMKDDLGMTSISHGSPPRNFQFGMILLCFFRSGVILAYQAFHDFNEMKDRVSVYDLCGLMGRWLWGVLHQCCFSTNSSERTMESTNIQCIVPVIHIIICMIIMLVHYDS